MDRTVLTRGETAARTEREDWLDTPCMQVREIREVVEEGEQLRWGRDRQREEVVSLAMELVMVGRII